MQLIIVFILFFQSFNSNHSDGNIKITVTGIESEKGGQLLAAIYTKDKFLKDDYAVATQSVEVYGSSMEISFKNIQPGEYGIALYQDIDKNNKLNTNLVGFPKEPFGFSNNAKLRFGPPTFKDAAVRVEAGKTLQLSVKLR